MSSSKRGRKRQDKPRWTNPDTGDNLSAGGILFHSNDSFWAIEEDGKKGIETNDIGGRYEYEDGDIFTTIRRELHEETYGMCDVPVSMIRKFAETYGMKGVYDKNRQCVYVCICVPIDVICETCGFSEEEIEGKFASLREKTVKQNPNTPRDAYKPLRIRKIRYEDVLNGGDDLSRIGYRLQIISNQLFKGW
jgi:hypothetical protein